MTHGISSLHNVPCTEKRAWRIAQPAWRKIGKTEEEEEKKKGGLVTVLMAKMKAWLFCCAMAVVGKLPHLGGEADTPRAESGPTTFPHFSSLSVFFLHTLHLVLDCYFFCFIFKARDSSSVKMKDGSLVLLLNLTAEREGDSLAGRQRSREWAAWLVEGGALLVVDRFALFFFCLSLFYVAGICGATALMRWSTRFWVRLAGCREGHSVGSAWLKMQLVVLN